MERRAFLVLGIVGLLMGARVERRHSSWAAEPSVDQPPSAPATPGVAAQADDGARAQALLAEFRTAEKHFLGQPQTSRAGAHRSQIEIGRDLTQLGRSAGPVLIEALGDSNDEVAAVAALALGRIGERRAVEPMLKILQSVMPLPESPTDAPLPGRLRVQACVCALGELREPRSVGPIVYLARMRNEASSLIEQLGFQDHSWNFVCGIMPIVCGDSIARIGEAAVPELVRQLSDEDDRTRRTAAEYLGWLGVRDGQFEDTTILSVAEKRRDRDESDAARNKRLASERVIARRVAELTGAKLIDLLHDKHSEVRGAAATALGNLRVSSAVGPLIDRLKDEDSDLQFEAGTALGQIGDPAALDALAALHCDFDMGRIGGPKAFALLKAALENADPKHRQSALSGLSALGTPEAVGLLIAASNDKAKDVRLSAVRELKNSPEKARVIERLIAATRDEDSEVRIAALQGLGQIADPRGVDAAMRALRDRKRDVRDAALDALGRLGSKLFQGGPEQPKDP